MVTTVSILMPVRNAEAFIGLAIRSVRQQTFGGFELIVVVDGSTDGSEATARQHAEADERIRVVANPGSGLTSALNAAAELARGPFLARLDADDEMAPRRLEAQLEFLSQSSDVILVGSSAVVIDEHSGAIRRIKVPCRDRVICAQLMRRNPFVHSSIMLRKDVFAKVGGYREKFPFVEDYDLWLRVAAMGRLANLSEPLIRYRQNPDGVSERNRRQQELNRKLCLLNWRKDASLISELDETKLAGRLVECDARQTELEVSPRQLRREDLRLFASALPLLGSAEARRLAKLVTRNCGQGYPDRLWSARFLSNALVASRVAYALTAGQGRRRLAKLRHLEQMDRVAGLGRGQAVDHEPQRQD